MTRPVGKIPYEIFGHSTGENVNETVKRHFQDQYCRFIGGECLKPRKSQPETKIGSCVLGYRVKGIDHPVIICPHRFEEDIVFRTIEEQYFPNKNVKWVKEVQLGDRGSIDYVAAVPNGNKDLDDFLCVEFQAGGTTGTPWGGIEYFREKYTVEGMPDVRYGINWANEFIKTMMQQINKKGSLIEEWNRQIVIVIQDVGMDYIRTQGGGIGDFDPEKTVQFLPFKLDYMNCGWNLTPSKLYSADMAGVREALLSSKSDTEITEEMFEKKILEKGERDRIWEWN